MKKNRIWVIGATAFSLALLSHQSQARFRGEQVAKMQVRWDRMGQGNVQPNDKGVGTVNATPGKPVQSIKIRVVSGGMNIHKCEVWFSDGSKKEVELRNDVPPGSESREISVGESLKHISKVVFWYDTRNYNKNASVELWGKKLS